MIRNVELDEEQQNDANACETDTSSQIQVAIPDADNSVVRASELSSSDEWSSNDEDDDRKQVAEIKPQAPENKVQVINTYTDCTNVSSKVHNTNIYKDGVTVNNYFYCCPASIDYVVNWWQNRRRIIIITLSVLVILLVICLSAWLLYSYLQMLKSSKDAETETTSIVPTTGEIPQSTIIPPISTDSTTSSTTRSTSSTDSSNSSSTEIPSHHWKIIERKDWGALPPISYPIILNYLPPKYVIFSETETETCTLSQECKEIVRNIQAAQMKNGLKDIAYNFIIGGDGMTYEGRGWDVFASVKDYDWDYFDDWSISVSFVGKFDVNQPTEVVLESAKRFLEFGSLNDKLVGKPSLKCLRQLSYTKKNPGDNLYEIIKTWKGWDNITIV